MSASASWTAVSVIWSCLICTAAAHAQNKSSPCNQSYLERAVGAEDPALSYQLRESDERCEGTYGDAQVSSNGFRVVAFFQGRKGGPFQVPYPSPVIELAPIRKHAGAVTATAVPFVLDAFYRMDAFLPADRPLRWPLHDVLIPGGRYSLLKLNTLGYYGMLTGQDSQVFVPLVDKILPSSEKAIYIFIHTPVQLDSARWFLLRSKSQDCREGDEEERVNMRGVNADALIKIDLSGKKGRYHLNIRGEGKDMESVNSCFVIEI